MDAPTVIVKEPRFRARAHAESLIGRIQAFWHEQGHAVEVWLEEPPVYDFRGAPVFPVRSNLRNGLPENRG